MAKKRASLGRGLAALLGDATPAEASSAAGATEAGGESEGRTGRVPAMLDPATGLQIAEDETVGSTAQRDGRLERVGRIDHLGQPVSTVVDLPVTAVRPNPRQPRRRFDPDALEELARSIASTGVVQPIIVRPLEGGIYELIAGERRWRASQMAGYTVVPAILRRASDVESLEISLIENVVRQQLNPVDEAFALHVLLDDLGVTQEALAERIGKSRAAVTNKLRLLDLPAEIQELMAGGGLSEGHGRALLGLKQRGEQLKLARRAATQGLSVRAVEAEVKRRSMRTEPEQDARAVAAIPSDLEEEARDSFWGALEVVPRIRLGSNGAAGRVELPFRDLDELRRMLARLAPRG